MQTCPFSIRETPISSALKVSELDSAQSSASLAHSLTAEPILNPGNIQGSILAGFNKSHRFLLFLRVDRAKITGFKAWLKAQIPFVATSDEVIAFNRLFKETRSRRGREGAVKSTWMNLAFSFEFLCALNAEADQFRDTAFRDGLANRSVSLGDPASGPYRKENWLVGGPSNCADVVVMIEADDRCDLLDELSRVQDTIDASRNPDGTVLDTGISTIFLDEGANLPAPLTGHEHFGFLDGVSQPGLRGLLSKDPKDVLTPRQNPLKRDLPKDTSKPVSPTNPIQPAQGKPGQDLLYPGEFVFGYPQQIEESNDLFDGPNGTPGPDSLRNPGGKGPVGPGWAQDGSFLVFRRLRQDVGGFHRFLHDTVDSLRAQGASLSDPPNASAVRYVGSKLVGRWPSGAPAARTPDDEAPGLGADDCKNNYFEFQDDAEALPTRTPTDPSACLDDGKTFPLAEADPNGIRCPFTSHIRKAYPRDDRPLGIPDGDEDTPPSESSTQTHRLLRRGLPYGPVSSSTPEAPVDDDVDRGLQFLAYQTSIDRQFEFVTKSWVNSPDFKEPFNPSPDGEPENQGGGHDPIIGQNGAAGENRIRRFTVTVPDAASAQGARAIQVTTEAFQKKTGKTDWVAPTGGGYFFTPSLDALKHHLT